MADKSRLPILGLITVLTGPMKGRSFQIHKPLTLIGRDPAKNDVVINDTFVSLHQARLRWRNGSSIIESLDQKNLVQVNEQIIHQVILNDNDIIGLGVETTIRFLSSDEAQETSQTDVTVIMPLFHWSIPSLEVSSNISSKKKTYLINKDSLS